MFHITITAPLPTNKYFQNRFQYCSNIYLQQNLQVEMLTSREICFYTSKTFFIIETNCILAYICKYLHIYLRQNLYQYHHPAVCRLKCGLEERSDSPPLKTFLSPNALLPLSHSQCTGKFLKAVH